MINSGIPSQPGWGLQEVKCSQQLPGSHHRSKAPGSKVPKPTMCEKTFTRVLRADLILGLSNGSGDGDGFKNG